MSGERGLWLAAIPVAEFEAARANSRARRYTVHETMRADLRARLRTAAVELVDALADLLTANDVDGVTPGGLLTVVEVAARLHRSTSAVRAWCAAGRFAGGFKLNNRDWRVPVEGLAAFITAQQPKPSRQDAPGRPITTRKVSGPTSPRARGTTAPDLGAWRRLRP